MSNKMLLMEAADNRRTRRSPNSNLLNTEKAEAQCLCFLCIFPPSHLEQSLVCFTSDIVHPRLYSVFRCTNYTLYQNRGISLNCEMPRKVLVYAIRLVEVALQQALESLAVTGLVTGHLMSYFASLVTPKRCRGKRFR